MPNNNTNFEKTVFFGDGMAQHKLFQDVRDALNAEKTTVTFGTAPAKQDELVNEVLMSDGIKYKVIAVRTYALKYIEALRPSRYQVMIENKSQKQTETHVGTMAHLMFDLLNDKKVNQK